MELNTSSLSEIEYINCVKSAIQRTKDEYAGDISVSPSLFMGNGQMESDGRISEIRGEELKKRKF